MAFNHLLLQVLIKYSLFLFQKIITVDVKLKATLILAYLKIYSYICHFYYQNYLKSFNTL